MPTRLKVTVAGMTKVLELVRDVSPTVDIAGRDWVS
jgi:hypothetical protein